MITARLPHAALNVPTRILKARKISALLGIESDGDPLRLLEVGTGSGVIAYYFGTRKDRKFEVDAVDVLDNRVLAEGYHFQLVKGTSLPFADNSFDVVISNHVIEHVGNDAAQRNHLAELRRILAVDGKCYLSVPNRWMLVEPHFKLPFLSWLPRKWRTPYLRLARRGHVYDCEPLQLQQLEDMLVDAGFRFCNIGVDALRTTLRIERPHSAANRFVRMVPDSLLLPWRRIVPTLIYRIWV